MDPFLIIWLIADRLAIKKVLFQRLSIFCIHCVLDCCPLSRTFSFLVKSKMDDEIDFAALANINIGDELTALAPASSLELSAEEASRHEGLSPAGQHLSIVFGDDATLSGPSSRAGTSARRKKGNQSPSDAKPSGIMGMNFMKPFSGVQKKITRGKQMCETHARDGRLTNE